jgi:hypothetical protein
MWADISNDINSVSKKTFSNDPKLDRQFKLKYLSHELKEVIFGFVKLY